MREPAKNRGSWPTSHCLDQTSRVRKQNEAERKRVAVLAENVTRFYEGKICTANIGKYVVLGWCFAYLFAAVAPVLPDAQEGHTR